MQIGGKDSEGDNDDNITNALSIPPKMSLRECFTSIRLDDLIKEI